MKGKLKCKFHGGAVNKNRKGKKKHVRKRLPVIYGKYLNKTLHDALENMLGIKPSDQLQCLEELALIRDFAGKSVAVYAAATESGKTEAIMAAGQFMTGMMVQVTNIAEKAAKISAATSDVYSIHDIQYIVTQLVGMLYKVCGDENDQIAIAFEKMVKEQLVLPRQPEGVLHEPHQDVADMDSMVPRLENK